MCQDFCPSRSGQFRPQAARERRSSCGHCFIDIVRSARRHGSD
jgi:hypothetical protein